MVFDPRQATGRSRGARWLVCSLRPVGGTGTQHSNNPSRRTEALSCDVLLFARLPSRKKKVAPAVTGEVTFPSVTTPGERRQGTEGADSRNRHRRTLPRLP